MNKAPSKPEVFGQFEGQPVYQVSLGKAEGLQAQIMTWGAVLRDLSWPLGGGRRLPLTLGFETFEPYPAHSPYFGAVVGRYANRIAGGRFTLGGQLFQLDRNEENTTTLHGGSNGFSQRLWHIADYSENSVTLTLVSLDSEGGFPGNLEVSATYSIHNDTRLHVQFIAKTDQATPVNLSQHSYFNLDGGLDISDHVLTIYADGYTPIHSNGIPTGSIAPVENTVFDFRKSQSLKTTEQMFDHNFVLSEPLQKANNLRRAAHLASHKSGISMLVETSKPGLQFYDGHKLKLSAEGLDGRLYRSRAGLCLETQYFPNSPNQADFPNSILLPETTYEHSTVYSFEV